MGTLAAVQESFTVNRKVIQPVVLFGSLIAGLALAFGSSMFTTRYLSPTDFGNMKLIVAIWYLLEIFINFGFFHSAGQALLKEGGIQETREIIGTDILIAILMGITLTIIMLAISKPIETIFKIQIAETMIVLAPLMMIHPLKDALMLILQCTNKIFLLAILNMVPSLLFLLFLIAGPRFFAMRMSIIIGAQQISLLVVVFCLIVIIKPNFRNVREWFRKIVDLQKTYGLPVYTALLCGNATQQINRIAIVYWVDSQAIGFYALASQLVDPLRLIPSSVASASFRDFANKKKISKRMLVITVFATSCALLTFQFLVGKPLAWLYPSEYAMQVSPMSQIMAFGAVILGFSELLNRFLGAHGKGQELKIAAYIFGSVYLLGFFIMTPVWGVWGTVAASVLASISNLCVMLYFYRRSSFGVALNTTGAE